MSYRARAKMNHLACRNICKEIVEIMDEYNRQMRERGHINTPGGFEHLGDVWSTFQRWDSWLLGPMCKCGYRLSKHRRFTNTDDKTIYTTNCKAFIDSVK